jgi:hypothetical protein
MSKEQESKEFPPSEPVSRGDAEGVDGLGAEGQDDLPEEDAMPHPSGSQRLAAVLQHRGSGASSSLGAAAKPSPQPTKPGKMKRPASKASEGASCSKKRPAAAVSSSSVNKRADSKKKAVPKHKTMKRRAAKAVKMTRECVYSRAYHGAQSIVAAYSMQCERIKYSSKSI